MATTNSGASEAARVLDETRRQIFERCNNAVTLSRSDAIEAVFEAWQATDENWKVNDDEVVVTEDVRDTAIRFIQNLPLGFPQPEVTREPDGHINFEWYRSPRRKGSQTHSFLTRAPPLERRAGRGRRWF
jgi:hypothetical protein